MTTADIAAEEREAEAFVKAQWKAADEWLDAEWPDPTDRERAVARSVWTELARRQMEEQDAKKTTEEPGQAQLPADGTPTNWRLVPLQPTDAMLAAGQRAWAKDRLLRSSTLFTAMVEAAPKRELWQPSFDACSVEQEKLVLQFCEEIRNLHVPDPVRLLEMAAALYEAERNSVVGARYA